jgi:hypothetical protein
MIQQLESSACVLNMIASLGVRFHHVGLLRAHLLIVVFLAGNCPTNEAGTPGFPSNPHRPEDLDSKTEGASLGASDGSHNAGKSLRGEPHNNDGPSVDSHQDAPTFWDYRTHVDSGTEVRGTQVLGCGGFSGLAPWTSSAAEETSGPLTSRPLGTSVPRVDDPALWEPGEAVKPSIFDSSIHADIHDSTLPRSARPGGFSGNCDGLNLNVRGGQQGASAMLVMWTSAIMAKLENFPLVYPAV